MLSDLSVCWPFSEYNETLRYEGIPINSALYVRRFSLNLIRDLIGNQCSDLSWGLDCFIFFGTTEEQRITVVKATAY